MSKRGKLLLIPAEIILAVDEGLAKENDVLTHYCHRRIRKRRIETTFDILQLGEGIMQIAKDGKYCLK